MMELKAGLRIRFNKRMVGKIVRVDGSDYSVQWEVEDDGSKSRRGVSSYTLHQGCWFERAYPFKMKEVNLNKELLDEISAYGTVFAGDLGECLSSAGN